MDMEKLTAKSREAMVKAQETAVEYGHQEIRPIHLLYALVNQEQGLIPSLLKRMKIEMERVNGEIISALEAIPSVSGPGAQQTYTSRDFSQVLITAKNKAEEMKDEFISVEHLFLALLEDKTCEKIRFLRLHISGRRLLGLHRPIQPPAAQCRHRAGKPCRHP